MGKFNKKIPFSEPAQDKTSGAAKKGRALSSNSEQLPENL
jgi:hypothetical protein